MLPCWDFLLYHHTDNSFPREAKREHRLVEMSTRQEVKDIQVQIPILGRLQNSLNPKIGEVTRTHQGDCENQSYIQNI